MYTYAIIKMGNSNGRKLSASSFVIYNQFVWSERNHIDSKHSKVAVAKVQMVVNNLHLITNVRDKGKDKGTPVACDHLIVLAQCVNMIMDIESSI